MRLTGQCGLGLSINYELDGHEADEWLGWVFLNTGVLIALDTFVITFESRRRCEFMMTL